MAKKIMIDIGALPSIGGKARAAALSEEERSEAARKAVRARWDAYYRLHPGKLKEKLAKRKEAAR
jgi:hypothetical protein